MKKHIYGIFLVLCLCLYFGCTHDKLIAPDSTSAEGQPCDPNVVFFENQILPIIRSNCAYSGCHGDGSAEDDVELSTYSSIIATGGVKKGDAADSKLYKVITISDPSDVMPPPPASPLSGEQIQLIKQWIDQGALNNECLSNLECDIENVSFLLNIQPLVQNMCQGCHSGGSPQGGISLANYIEIKASVESGRFLGSIRHNAGYAAMPPNSAKLSSCEIDQISKWIDEGAQNN